jgi:diguanylate cyclase (GGDEF)-like protein/PAS domain S-box-containing protein
MLIVLAAASIVITIIGVPDAIVNGIKGQAAIVELDGIRHTLLEVKAATARLYFSKYAASIADDLKKTGTRLESSLEHYEKAANYNSVLANEVIEFAQACNRWLNAEKIYIEEYSESAHWQTSPENEDFIAKSAFENNALFLEVLQQLADGERPIHDDITKGRQATRILLGTGFLIIIYFFFITIIYQRNSNRIQLIREQNLEVTLRSIGDAVIATDIQGYVTCMNPEAERLTGWKYKNAQGCLLSEVFRVVNEENGETVEDVVAIVKHEKGVVVLAEESMLISADGNRYQIYENGAPIYDYSGTIIGVVLVFRDISQAYELKSQLNDTAKRLQRVVDTSMDAVIVTDEAGMVKEWNAAAEAIFGWSYAEIIKCPIYSAIIPEEFREQHLRGIDKLVKSERSPIQSKRIESLALHKDGHTFPIEMAMASVRTEKGWVFNAFIRDLTEQKKNKKTMERDDALLRKTQHIAKLGYWDLDLIEDTLEWSDEIYKIFCQDPKTTRPSYKLFMNSVHPDDRARVDAAYSESIKYKIPYNIIHRIVTDEGVKIVHEQCETTYDDDMPVLSTGLVQDITEHINLLEELRVAATTFKTHAGILITEKDGTILRANPAFEKMTGYSSDELVGRNPRILHSGMQGDAFYADMWSKVNIRGMWEGELWNKRKDGTLYAEWLTITAVKSDEGEVTHYVGTSQDITMRKQAELQIEHLAYHDDLTNLANRRLLRDRLYNNIASCKRDNEFGAVLLLGLDRFKDLNDSLGHVVGDDVLCMVALRLKQLVGDCDTVARIGGDEFVVVLASVGDELSFVRAKVQTIAEKIRTCLSLPYKLKEAQCYSNVSIGVTVFPGNTDNLDDTLKQADTALHRAKAQGRNTVCFYDFRMQAEAESRHGIFDGLRNALMNNEFILYYQPQLNDRGELLGAEALLRWAHPEQGIIQPARFIAAAEDTGLIQELGLWVMREVARQMGLWQAAGIYKQSGLRLAINVSPSQFHQRDFVAQVIKVFGQEGVALDCIELEVTEGLLMDSLDEVIEKMHELRTHGVRISIDDFGTGYSSLAYLKRLPLDQLKIDQSFVRDITHNVNDAVVVETIIAMARHLGLSVIAEGVENREQLDFLISNGCNAYQGYYFSHPLQAEDFACYVKQKTGGHSSIQE